MKKAVLLLFIGFVTLNLCAQEKAAKIEFKSEQSDDWFEKNEIHNFFDRR